MNQLEFEKQLIQDKADVAQLRQEIARKCNIGAGGNDDHVQPKPGNNDEVQKNLAYMLVLSTQKHTRS